MNGEEIPFWQKEIKEVAKAIVVTSDGRCEATFYRIAGGESLYPVVGNIITPKKEKYKKPVKLKK